MTTTHPTFRDFLNGYLASTDLTNDKKFEMVLNVTLTDHETTDQQKIALIECLTRHYWHPDHPDMVEPSGGYYTSNIFQTTLNK